MKRVLLWALVGLAVIAIIATVALVSRNDDNEPTDSSDKQSERLVGVSLSPRSFGAKDYLAFFDKAAEAGNALSWAGPYSDLAKTTNNPAETVLEQSKNSGSTPVIITGPGKGEVFDGIFRQGFSSAVLEFVKANEVPYLGIGNEIDELYLDSPAKYDAFIALANDLASQVKIASPETKVITIFQLERMKGLNGGLFGGVNNTDKNTMALLDGLKSFDMVAFTTYPCLIYKSPAEIPEEYYSDIANHTDLPVIFTEVGWFRETPVAGWESSEQEQADFISRFEDLTTRLNPQLLLWPFLFDQDIPEPFKQIGLLGVEQQTSLGYEAWKSYPKQ